MPWRPRLLHLRPGDGSTRLTEVVRFGSRDTLAGCWSLLVNPQLQTCRCVTVTDALCHFRTHAPLQFHNSRSPRGCGYSITASARAINLSGTVSPTALAVLRLMTSSNWDGCALRRSRRRIQHPAAIGSLALQVSNVEKVRIFCGFPERC